MPQKPQFIIGKWYVLGEGDTILGGPYDTQAAAAKADCYTSDTVIRCWNGETWVK